MKLLVLLGGGNPPMTAAGGGRPPPEQLLLGGVNPPPSDTVTGGWGNPPQVTTGRVNRGQPEIVYCHHYVGGGGQTWRNVHIAFCLMSKKVPDVHGVDSRA